MADGYIKSSTAVAQPTSRAAWQYWLLPSIADLILVGVLSAILLTPLSVKVLGDAGIGWHIRIGQQILATHVIPHVDPFSVPAGKTWFAWEWLYDIVAGKLEAAWGLNGVVWFAAVVIGLVFGWTFRWLITRRTNLPVALGLVLLAISASTIHWLARPHLLSWLFTLVWFVVLDSTERRSLYGGAGLHAAWLWVLPISMLVWVNVHGGFLLGCALLTLFWLSAWSTWLRLEKSRVGESPDKIAARRRARHLFWLGAVTAGATLVNPYGWRLHQHIDAYLSNRFLMDHIDEFQSPDFHELAPKCFLFLLLVAVVILIVQGSRMRLSQGLVVVLAIYMGLTASRNIPTSSILLALIVGPLAVSEGGAFWHRMAAVEVQTRSHIWSILAIALSLAVTANGGKLGSDQLMDSHFDPQRMPVDAVNFLEEHQAHGPILSPDYWGGYVIFRLYPNEKVVLDDRHDFYGESFMKSYVSLWHVEPGWAEILNRTKAACLVLPTKSTLAQVLPRTESWETIYSDDVATVFVRIEQSGDTGHLGT